MGSGSGPEQVEDGIGAFLSGGRDVDGEAKEARVIAPVQQYLFFLMNLIMKFFHDPHVPLQ